MGVAVAEVAAEGRTHAVVEANQGLGLGRPQEHPRAPGADDRGLDRLMVMESLRPKMAIELLSGDAVDQALLEAH